MNQMRIAITGIGLVTPFSLHREQSWHQLLQGGKAGRFFHDCGAESADTAGAKLWYGAPVEMPAELLTQSRTSAFAQLAAAEAVTQAGITQEMIRETACVVGTSKTDLNAVDEIFHSLKEGNQSLPIAPIFPSEPASDLAQYLRSTGPVIAPVAACATGLVSIIRAAELLRHGDASRAIAGSTDSSLHIGLLSSYRRLGVLARPGTDPSLACRPFDSERGGFIVGEGAGCMVLEDWEQARKRGVAPIAEWVDGLIGSDPSGLTSVDASGEILGEWILRLLRRNRVSPEKISAICYHGTATEMNDLTEARAIAKVFPHTPIGFGIKGAIGHLMGAAGSVETCLSALALRDQVVPPTANHRHHDERCPNVVTGAVAVQQPLEYILKTSLGFGGHVAVGLLKRATEQS